MSPHVCTMCETSFCNPNHNKLVFTEATVLFADIRGFTGLSDALDQSQLIDMLSIFYENSARAMWNRDGIINKLIGDAVFAIFNWPIQRRDHIIQAVLAGIALQEKYNSTEPRTGESKSKDTPVGVGVGIHTGNVSVGEIGDFYHDLTAIGQVVNVAARLQSVAETGEVVMTEDVYRHVSHLFPDLEPQMYTLKGIHTPVVAYVLTARVLATRGERDSSDGDPPWPGAEQ